MVYKRRSYTRKPYTFKKKRVVARKKRYVRKILSYAAETKHKDTTIAETAITTSGVLFVSIPQIARGTSDNSERIGDSINIKSLRLKWRTYIGSGASPDNVNIVRCVIFQWYDCNVTPVVSDVLESVGAANSYMSQYKWDNKGRYRIIYDRTVSMSKAGTSNYVCTKLITRGFKRQMRYDGALNTDIINNGLYILFISDSGTVDHPFASAELRLNYTDL